MLRISNQQMQCISVSGICVFPFSDLVLPTCLGIVIWDPFGYCRPKGSNFAPRGYLTMSGDFWVVTVSKILLESQCVLYT